MSSPTGPAPLLEDDVFSAVQTLVRLAEIPPARPDLGPPMVKREGLRSKVDQEVIRRFEASLSEIDKVWKRRWLDFMDANMTSEEQFADHKVAEFTRREMHVIIQRNGCKANFGQLRAFFKHFFEFYNLPLIKKHKGKIDSNWPLYGQALEDIKQTEWWARAIAKERQSRVRKMSELAAKSLIGLKRSSSGTPGSNSDSKADSGDSTEDENHAVVESIEGQTPPIRKYKRSSLKDRVAKTDFRGPGFQG